MVGNREFVQTQWQQAVETFRTQISMLVQWSTIMAVANVTVLGYATAQRLGSVLALGAVFPAIVVAMLERFKRHTQPIIYTAIRIEMLESEQDFDALATTYVAQIAGAAYLTSIQRAASNSERAERMRCLSSVRPPPFFGSPFLMPFLYVASVGQLLVAAWLGSQSGWSYF